jgi:hypothetical protein
MIVQLKDIDSSGFKTISEKKRYYGDQDHSRNVYKDPTTNRFYKVWNSDYIRRDNFINTYNLGYFKNLAPALVGPIMDGDVCVGYIMEAAITNMLSDTREFFDVLKSETERLGWFYYDWMPQHLMQYDSKPTLIDLESVYPIADLQNVLDHKYNCAFRNQEYKEFVWNIYQSMNSTLEV